MSGGADGDGSAPAAGPVLADGDGDAPAAGAVLADGDGCWLTPGAGEPLGLPDWLGKPDGGGLPEGLWWPPERPHGPPAVPGAEAGQR